ncbi:MAG: hypothetical protein J6V22_02505 [Clostridia bacterium]|nr:hypothetical protein [Clostridia bacterium]
MALSSFGTKLMIGTKPYDIKDFPEILGQRSALETTTLSDDAQTFIPGIRQQSENFPFVTNYDATVYAEINALTGEQECKLTFSDGSGFTWNGFVSASINEGSVDSVLEMTIVVVPSDVPVWSKGA